MMGLDLPPGSFGYTNPSAPTWNSGVREIEYSLLLRKIQSEDFSAGADQKYSGANYCLDCCQSWNESPFLSLESWNKVGNA
jgi:hypothetical protein